MSDKNSESGTGAATGGPQFTERELELLSYAMRSLKSGPPEIDYEKLAAFAGMSNPRSASNAWAKIKNKLMISNDGTASPNPKSTPKKKNAAKANGAEGTPKKTTRKRASTVQDANGEASPKKKSRASKPATAPAEEENTEVKNEDAGDSQELQANDSDILSEPPEDII